MMARICPETTAPLMPFKISFRPGRPPVVAALALETFTLNLMLRNLKSTCDVRVFLCLCLLFSTSFVGDKRLALYRHY